MNPVSKFENSNQTKENQFQIKPAFSDNSLFYINYLKSIKEASEDLRQTQSKQSKSVKFSQFSNINTNVNDSFSTCNTVILDSPKSEKSKKSYISKKYPLLQNIYSPKSSISLIDKIPKNSLFLIIKSFNIENIHKAIKYKVWSSTYTGNSLLNDYFHKTKARNANVYMFFSTNSTYSFQGIAKLSSSLQKQSYKFWKGNEKYNNFVGSFKLEWEIIKDVPNSSLDVVLCEGYPFSKIRNGIEVSSEAAYQAISVIENFFYCSSLILDDFERFDFEEENES